MNKKKFRLLAGFMIFTLFAVIGFAAYEVKSYLNGKSEVNLSENKKEDTHTVPKEKIVPSQSESTKDKKIVNSDKSEEKISIRKETSLLFTGDALLTNSSIQIYNRNSRGITGILAEDILAELKNADITMVNQEFPFSTRGTQMKDKQYTFKMDPKYVKIFEEMSVDIVSLANNHTLDFGIEALLDTIETLDNIQIKHVGAGENLEKAKAAEYIRVNEKTFAFLGASRVIPVYSWNAAENSAGLFTTYDPELLLEEIKTAKSKSDFVVVYVHWGIEKKNHPEEYQRNLGKQYIDAGADIVIGSHPHVLQGIEFYNEKPIVYSLGNFVFGNSTFETMLLKVNVNDSGEMELSIVPCEAKNGFTEKLSDTDEMIQFYNYIESISYHTRINQQGSVLQVKSASGN